MGPWPSPPKPVRISCLAQIDVFEINEAFAAQAVYCVRKLGIPMHKVNPL